MMNKIILMGRLTRDPELRTTESGISRTTFSLAVQRKTKNEDGNYEVDFIDCVTWRGTADVIFKHFRKGSQICVEGSIRKDSFTDKDGNTKYNTYVLVDGFDFVGTQKETQSETQPSGNESILADEIELDDDSLPF